MSRYKDSLFSCSSSNEKMGVKPNPLNNIFNQLIINWYNFYFRLKTEKYFLVMTMYTLFTGFFKTNVNSLTQLFYNKLFLIFKSNIHYFKKRNNSVLTIQLIIKLWSFKIVGFNPNKENTFIFQFSKFLIFHLLNAQFWNLFSSSII